MLENLEPKQVFHYFEEICKIPHASYHVDAISDYLVNFAKSHNLYVEQDDLKNVIIIKEASKGMEQKAPIMIQGHMDMVAVKDDDANIDLLKDSLDLAIDGDYVYAKGTSLGGDDGIAIAYGLALLSDESLKLPRIELVITTEEEVGMEGATGIDLSSCKARQMLNLDSEDEGEFVVACAGGVSVHAYIPIEVEKITNPSNYLYYEVTVDGLTGGHSGTEIIWNRANACKVLGVVLRKVSTEAEFELVSIDGGLKDNAIPISAKAVIAVKKEGMDSFEQTFADASKEIEKYRETDENGIIGLHNTNNNSENALKPAAERENNNDTTFFISNKATILDFLCDTPNGVQKMSEELEGLVQTSLNLGIMECDLLSKKMHFVFSVRSSVAEEKTALYEKVCDMIKECGGTFELKGDYPAWEYRKESPLREHLVSIYKKQYGKEPKVLSLHAGLECGILLSKVPDLDCVSLGPDILDIHTTKEKLSISSVKRVWDYLLEVIDTL